MVPEQWLKPMLLAHLVHLDTKSDIVSGIQDKDIRLPK